MAISKITQLIHHPYHAPAGFEAPQIGVYKASTVLFPSVAAMRTREWKEKSGYTYGLHGTPTTFVLEERISALEGGLQCVLVPSGLAAITSVDLALLATGDEMLLPHNVYGSRLAFSLDELLRFGITTRFYDAMDAVDLASKITPKTKLVWLEAPGSVTMEFPDLAALVRICRERSTVCALDNTWGAGLAFNAFDLDGQGDGVGLGVDISIQALTKYPSGGGDVLMGSIVTRNEALHQKIKLSHMRIGFGVAANDAELILRSLPSIEMRYLAADQTARQLARWLQTRPEIEAVLHPALAGSPGHANWRDLCRKQALEEADSAVNRMKLLSAPPHTKDFAAGLFSIVFRENYSQQQVDAFVDALQFFKIGYSWGGHLSLAMPYDITSMRNPVVSHWPYRGALVRFSIGFEQATDLQNDLMQALVHLI
jgi:cysteine-S-conjugate beta-lyase